MPSTSALRNRSKVSKTPRRFFEKERMDQELKLLGEYGLRNKREIWRVGKVLSHVRAVARHLLTLDEKNPKRLFEGTALIRRLHRDGILDESKNTLDLVLALGINDFFDRRLQTQVFRLGLAKSIHHARVLILQGHIRVRSHAVTSPSFIVRTDAQKHIQFSASSPYGGGRPGRVRRRKLKAKAEKAKEGAGAAADEE